MATSTSDKPKNHWVFVCIQIVHSEAKWFTRVFDCQLSNNPPKKHIHPKQICPALFLWPDIVLLHAKVWIYNWPSSPNCTHPWDNNASMAQSYQNLGLYSQFRSPPHLRWSYPTFSHLPSQMDNWKSRKRASCAYSKEGMPSGMLLMMLFAVSQEGDLQDIKSLARKGLQSDPYCGWKP